MSNRKDEASAEWIGQREDGYCAVASGLGCVCAAAREETHWRAYGEGGR